MKEISIVALNSPGTAALREHLEGYKKMGLREKLIFKTAGYRQEVVCENPLQLLLTVNNRHCDNPAFIGIILSEIDKALQDNGARKDEDYQVTVK